MIGLHQGLILSPCLFTLVLDVLIKHIQDLVPQCMLFTNNIVLIEESREELNGKLELWRKALEAHGKTKYMEYMFSKRCTNSNLKVKIEDNTIQVAQFMYLESII